MAATARTPASRPVTTPLPADTTAPAVARRAVRDFVAACGFGADVPEGVGWLAELAVSEFATNALRHAGGIDAQAEYWLGVRHLFVAVSDGDARLPEVLAPTADGESGRGLWILRQLTAELGWYRCLPGKCVFTAIDLQSDPFAGPALEDEKVAMFLFGDAAGLGEGVHVA